MHSSKPKTIDAYLAAVSKDKRAALQKLRKAIRAAAPKAEECISYQIPAFRLDGKFLLAFGAAANHCAFYPGAHPIASHKNELSGYDTSKGTIRFPSSKPLPTTLVKKLVKARIAEYAGSSAAKASRKPVKKRAEQPVTGSRHTGTSQIDPAVTEFLRKLNHPQKNCIEAVRQIILSVSPSIHEGIKWNAPSFRTTDYFATVNLRGKGGESRVWLIFHTGAKTKKTIQGKITDKSGLLQWLAGDRCLVTFDNAADIRAKRAALTTIIRQWIKQV